MKNRFQELNGKRLDIELRSGKWIKIDEFHFRSWTGLRKIDGVDYHGPIFMLGSCMPGSKRQRRVCPCCFKTQNHENR